MKHAGVKQAVLLCTVLLSLMPALGLTATASAESTVPYLDANGQEASASATAITGSATAWSNGW